MIFAARSRPGSVLWFMGHDMRLSLRRVQAMFRGSSGRRALTLVGAALVLFHLIAWPIAKWAAERTASGDRAIWPVVAGVLIFIIPWIVSQALTNATRALYSRGDLDLVLASPAPARAMFAARAAAIAIESVISVSIFILPIADMLAIVVGVRWLAIYPTLLACGLAGTALGLLLTMGLFKAAGPRRTRVLSQVLAAAIGAAFAIGLQLANLAPPSIRGLIQNRMDKAPSGGPLDMDGPFWTPVRAATGNGFAVLTFLGVSALVFAAACWCLGEAFAKGIVKAGDNTAPAPRATANARRFQPGAGAALRRKEWRLLRRDPWLSSQMLMQVVYTTPLCYVLWTSLGPNTGIAGALSPALVVIAAQLAGALAWVTLCTEDAPEFLEAAPVTRREVERAKMLAAGGPLLLVIGIPVLLMSLASMHAAVLTLVFACLAGASTALLNLWKPAPGRRGEVMRRHGQSKLVGIIEHTLALCWAVATALCVAGTCWFAAPAGLALGVLWLNRPRAQTA